MNYSRTSHAVSGITLSAIKEMSKRPTYTKLELNPKAS